MSQQTLKKLQPPSEERLLTLHALYEEIFLRQDELNSEYAGKAAGILNYLFAWESWSWRVVGISQNAFHQIIEQTSGNFSKGLVRHHFIGLGRKEIYSMMLEGTNPMGKGDFYECFWNRDKTVVMTKGEHENSMALDRVQVMELNWEHGYFSNAGLIGFKARKTIEREFLIQQQQNSEISWMVLGSLK